MRSIISVGAETYYGVDSYDDNFHSHSVAFKPTRKTAPTLRSIKLLLHVDSNSQPSVRSSYGDELQEQGSAVSDTRVNGRGKDKEG